MILIPETRWTYGVEIIRHPGDWGLITITAWDRVGRDWRGWEIVWDMWFVGGLLDRIYDHRRKPMTRYYRERPV